MKISLHGEGVFFLRINAQSVGNKSESARHIMIVNVSNVRKAEETLGVHGVPLGKLGVYFFRRAHLGYTLAEASKIVRHGNVLLIEGDVTILGKNLFNQK
jgi:hypothetical protein